MRTVSIRQPWAWLILAGLKDVENRSWRVTPGPLQIHAAKRLPYEDELADIEREFNVKIDWDALHFGGIVGTVNVSRCVTAHASPWFSGPVGWLLDSPRSLPFAACRGRLGLFEFPHEPRQGAPV